MVRVELLVAELTDIYVPSVLTVLWMYRSEQDPIKKEERKATLLKETIPFYLKRFEKAIAENGGFSVGNAVRA